MAKLFRSRSSSKNRGEESKLSRANSFHSLDNPDIDLMNERATHDHIFVHTEPDDISMYTSEAINEVKHDPVATYVAQALGAINQIKIKGKVDKATPLFNIEEFIKNYQNLQITEKESWKNELIDTFQKEMKTHQNRQLSNELNFHSLNPSIQCPDRFSETPTLQSFERKTNFFKLLPFGRNKFSGKHDSPPITEFLLNLNHLQDTYNLSRDEFSQCLLFSTTKNAFEIVSNGLKQAEPISAIYARLMLMFNDQMSPHDAKQKLMAYIAYRDDDFMTITSYILKLATSASRLCADPASRNSILNTEACHALIQSLPHSSQSLANTQFNVLASRNMSVPTYTDFCLFLQPHRSSIELDLKRNGAHRQNKYNIAYTNKQPFNNYKKTIYDITQRTPNYSSYNKNHSPMTSSSYRPKSYQTSQNPNYNRKRNQKQNYTSFNRKEPSNMYFNRLFCSLCGGRDHRASDVCYKMKDENGKIVKTTPVQNACSICERKNNIRLFHAEKFCFNKKQNNQRYQPRS